MKTRALLVASLALVVFACVPSPMAVDLDTRPDAAPDSSDAVDIAPDTLDVLDVLDVDLSKDLINDDHGLEADTPLDGDTAPEADADCCAALDCDAQLGESTTCRVVACDPSACECKATNQAGPCDDANACTTDDACVEGACAGTPVPKDDGLPCTDDACDPITGDVAHTLQMGHCLLPNAAEVPTCYLADDLRGDAGADSCWACKPFKDPHAWSPNAGFGCDDLNPCTVNDKCGTDGGCTGNDLGDLCICDSDAKCLTLDDGNFCNGVPTCNLDSNKCEIAAGSVVTCDPAGDTFCRENRCVHETGACAYKPLHETEACDDANACTGGDACQDGACVGAAVPFDDGLSCTDDACDPLTGLVSHQIVNGFCRVIDDGEARCVADGLLNAANGCQYCDTSLTSEAWSNNDDAACDAGAGTLEGVCVGGQCVAKGDLDGDGVADDLDNCPTVANPLQANADDDQWGDDCDDDDDNDDTPDGADCKPFDGAVHPGAIEACNGQDDDCDNATDQADPDLERPACDKQEGVCADTTKPATLCVDGVWKPCTAGTYLDHDPRYQAGSELTCDGADNNCDGLTDEGFTYLGLERGAPCGGSGACGQGEVECAADGKSALCSTNPGGSQYEPGVESCNGKDDDCDGLTDEGLSVADSTCLHAGVCDPSNVLATCAGGAWTCDYGHVPGYSEGVETVCDGLDNDCDGQTDEDFVLVLAGNTLHKDEPCSTGGCPGGVVVCTASGAGLVCSTDLTGYEACDGKDNDCDGQTDEGLAYLDPVSGNGYAIGTACTGLGECGVGTVECGANLVVTCSTNPDGSASEAATEACNGLDDDCDGDTDEGITWQGLDLGDGCDGTGLCGPGVVECSVDGESATCSTNPDGSASEAGAEACNGLDDDCDGYDDDDLTVYQSTCKLTGVCTPQKVVATCQAAAGWTCSYEGIADYVEGGEAGHCDGKDNDCDGDTDEDFSWQGLGLGDGCDGPDADQCPRGTVVCATNGLAAECAGDVAQVESCNGKDDDCDDLIDEAGASDCTTYFRDVDGDTWGGADSACLCAPDAASDYDAVRGGDCDDTVAAIHPDAAELCNGKDDDCDTKTDATDPGLATGDVQSCQNQKGVCTGSTKPVSLCQGGAWEACTPAIYATYSAAYQAGAETSCDGKDNDCDGGTDEDFSLTLPDGAVISGVAKPCGGGLCAGGQTQCAPTAATIECSTSYLAVTEVCNALDDDCDGKTDAQEANLAETDPRSCEKQQGVCAGSKKPSVLCVAGAWGSCGDAQYQGFSPSYEAGVELHCDGKDNDCNGQTDEDFALTLLDGTTVTGAGKPCGVGVCTNGTTACDAATTGIRCPSEASAVSEVCDAKDNDCDGKTDKTDPTLELTACEKQQGVCAGSKHVPAQCGGTGWTACTVAEYTAGGAKYEATTETSCDNLDNDCDGATDDDFTWLDPSDGKTKKKGDPCGTGACVGSVVVCKTDTTGLVCSESSGVEVCGDSIDNDCDGATDEEGAQNCVTYYKDADRDTFGKTADVKCLCAAAPATFYDTTKSGDCDDTKVAVNPDAPEVCNGVDDDCDTKTDATDVDLATDDVKSCENQKGVCSGSKKPVALCVSGTWQACATATYQAFSTYFQSPAETSCDAKDNDCDGTVDDDFAVTLPDGSTTTGIGKPCGTGACAGGTTQCKTDQAGIECSTSWKASTETCDTIDNDCDAKTDATDPSISRPTCEKQAGVCSGATKPATLCVAGAWGTCTNAVYTAWSSSYQSPTETTCDGLDNNCDFEVDHEFVAQTPDGSYFYGPGQACGTGVCAGGVTRCTASKLALECSTTGVPPYAGLAPEICNALDDDCDGKTDALDPDLPITDPKLCEKQAGVCAGSTKPVALCQAGAWQACPDIVYLAYDGAYALKDRVGDRCWGWGAWSLQGSLADVADAGDDLRLRTDNIGRLHIVSVDGASNTVVYQTWTPGGTQTATLIDASLAGASAPALDLQAGSLPVVAFLGNQGASVWVALALDELGTVWTTERVVTGAQGQFSSPAVVADDDGRLRLAWVDTTSGLRGTSKRPGGAWEPPAQLFTGSVGEVVARNDALGRLHVLYTSGAGANTKLTHLQFDGRDGTVRTVMSGNSDLIGIDLVIDDQNVLHVAAYDDGGTSLFYASDRSGAWASELVAADVTAQRPRIAVSPEGRVLISATDPSGTGGSRVVLWSNGSGAWAKTTPDTSVQADDSGLAFFEGVLYLVGHDLVGQATRLATTGCSRVGDPRDENCDGLDGVDADGDGYADEAYLGTDCNDNVAAIHPGATDTVGDNVDKNCDHVDGVDADHDRFPAKVGTTGTDCNDTNAAINPAAYERCNTQDDNCDAQIDANDPKLTTHDLQWCEKQADICQGSTKPGRLCVAGSWQPCDDAAYDAYNSIYDPVDMMGDRCITWVGGSGSTVATSANANAALAYDPAGTPHVVYRSSTGALLFATQNATTGAWGTTTIDTSGEWPSVAYFGDEIRVAYRRNAMSGVMFTRSTNGGSTWSTSEFVNGSGSGTTGSCVAIVLRVDRLGNDHIAFVDATNKMSYYAVRVRGTWNVTTIGLADSASPVMGLAVDADQHYHLCAETTGGDLLYATNKTGDQAANVIASGGIRSCDLELDAEAGVHVAYADQAIPAKMYYTSSTTAWKAETLFTTNGNIDPSPDLLVYDKRHVVVAFYGGNTTIPNWNILSMRNTTGAWVVDTDIPAANIGTPQGKLRAAWNSAASLGSDLPVQSYGIVGYGTTGSALLYRGRDCDDYSSTIDENCDGVDGIDADNDGAASRASFGGDCDDTDGSISPAASERCDGRDNDCDGATDEYAARKYTLESASKDGAGYKDVGERWDGQYVVSYHASAKKWPGWSTRPAGSGVDWTVGTFEDVADRGQLMAMAIDPYNGTHVAYRDKSNAKLVYAYKAGYSGAVAAVATVTDLDADCQSISIAVDQFGYPHISYQTKGGVVIGSAANLGYARLTTTGWTRETVDGGPLAKSGTYSSLRLVHGDTPAIAFYRDSASALGFAIRSGSSWTTYTIDSSSGAGQSVGLAADADTFYVAYRDATSKLRLAYAPLSLPGNWKRGAIDTTSTDSGLGVQIEADAQGGLHVLGRATRTFLGTTAQYADYWLREPGASTWNRLGSFDSGSIGPTFGLSLDRSTLWPLAAWGRTDAADAWFGTPTCE